MSAATLQRRYTRGTAHVRRQRSNGGVEISVHKALLGRGAVDAPALLAARRLVVVAYDECSD